MQTGIRQANFGDLVTLHMEIVRDVLDWDKYTTHAIGDFVRYRGIVWRALAVNAGVLPVAGATWAEDSGRLDPDGLTLTIAKPSGASSVYTLADLGGALVRKDVGLYRAEITANERGIWRGSIVTTGAQAAQPWELLIL